MKAQDCVLAIDQGTTSSRAAVFGPRGGCIGFAQKEFRQIHPAPGWVSQDPRDIYDSVIFSAREALTAAKVEIGRIAGIGITNQRETVVVWDRKTGEPVADAIVWQCRRTADICDQLNQSGHSETIYHKTGLVLDAYFSASKIQWILESSMDAKDRAARGELCFGTVDTYLMWRLSNGKIFKTDYTNASRTMLFDIHRLCWDQELLELFGIPAAMLPEVVPSMHDYGETDAAIFGAPVKIYAAAGDQQAALFGHLCVEEGDVKCTYGTGCFLLMNTGKTAVKSRFGLLTTLAASGKDRPDYVLEGSMLAGGSVIKWLRDGLGLIGSAAESEQIARSVESTAGVYFVPAFAGLAAPYWDSDARGIICGLSHGVTKAHIVRAALEAISYRIYDLLRAMERDTNIKVRQLDVDGGASRNNFLIQFQSDINGFSAVRPASIEMTVLGAAFLAGLKAGLYDSVESLQKIRAGSIDVFSPRIEEERRKILLQGWNEALARAKTKD